MADILQPPGRTISYFPKLTKITGSIKAAILCQQISYLTPREDDADTWIDKSQQEWIEDTGLTLKEFRGASEELEERKLIRKVYDRINHTLRIQLQISNYNAAIQELANGEPLTLAPAKRAYAKRAHTKRAPAKRAYAKRADGMLQKGRWHVPKGHLDNNVVKTDLTTELTTEKKDPTPPPSTRKRQSTPKHPFPDGYTPSDTLRAELIGKYAGVDVDQLAERMRDWAQSKGEWRSDWNATLRTFAARDWKDRGSPIKKLERKLELQL